MRKFKKKLSLFRVAGVAILSFYLYGCSRNRVSSYNTYDIPEVSTKAKKQGQQLFTDNGDGTVTDKASGLIWQRCSFGQEWIGSNCYGYAKKVTWEEAKKLNNNFGLKNDWRLPSINDLKTLIHCSDGDQTEKGYCLGGKATKPTIDTLLFPNTVTAAY